MEDGNGIDEVAADLNLAVAAQSVEHYEIAGNGSARTMAQALQNRQVVGLLEQTLSEEEETDKLFTQVAAPLLENLAVELTHEQQPSRSRK